MTDRRSSHPASRTAVIAALREHGLSGQLAATVWGAARGLVRNTVRRGIEHAMTFDAISGQEIGSTLTGTASGVSIDPHLQLFRRGRGYVTMHTHPRSTSFSGADVHVFEGQESITAMIAVGIDQTWYVMGRLPGFVVSGRRALLDAYALALAQQDLQHLDFRERTHGVMESIARSHGLRYDRLER